MRGFPVTYQDFSGGLNTQAAPYLLQGNQCRDSLNVHTSLSGDIEKRNGYVTLSGSSLTGSPVNATGVHTLFPANTTTKSLIGVATTSSTDTIFKLTTAGVATVLKTGFTAKTRWWFAQADVNAGEGPIFGMNGVDKPQRWNGTDAETHEWKASSGEVPPKGKFLTYWSERLWCAEGSRIWFSGITGSSPDPMNWESTNYVDLEPNDGMEITAIGVVSSQLVVFKARKIFVIYDPIAAANRKIEDGLGCVAPRSVVSTPVGLVFLSEDQGICVTDAKTAKPISDVIKPTIAKAQASPATMALAAGELDGRRYYLSLSLNGTRNDHTIEYDLITGSWWLHDCASNAFALSDPGGTPVLYSADSLASARVSKAFVEGVFTDNGSNYAGKSYYITPEYAWGYSGTVRYLKYVDPHKTKRIREVRVDGEGNWEAFIATNFSPAWELMVGEAWDSSGEAVGGFFEVADETTFEGSGDGTFEEEGEVVVDRHYHTPGLGRSASFRYLNNDSNNFKLYSQTVNIQLRED